MTTPTTQARPALLIVHAHPDDENLTTGYTIARYVRHGHRVHDHGRIPR